MPALAFSRSGSDTLGNPGTVTAPNPPNPGSLMVALALSVTSTGAITVPGFTASVLQVGNVATYMGMFKLAVAAGQTSSITATDAATPNPFQLQLAEFWGVSTTEDAVMVSSNGAATTPTSRATGSITTTSAVCLAVAYLGLAVSNASASIAIDSGFTVMSRNNRGAMAYRFVTPGSYNPTWSWPTASRVTTAIKVFQATPSAAGFLPIG